jgi:hypothetical protein
MGRSSWDGCVFSFNGSGLGLILRCMRLWNIDDSEIPIYPVNDAVINGCNNFNGRASRVVGE